MPLLYGLEKMFLTIAGKMRFMNPIKTYVIGHRNPDTDSVCSALAYAELLRLQGRQNIEAARAGNLNQQTEFVLEALGQEPPRRLADVYPRVGDVLEGQPVAIDQHQPLVAALELYHRHNIRMLPVIDAEQRPLGLLLLKEMTELFLLPTRPDEMRRVKISLNSLARCLHAETLVAFDADQLQALDLYVAARDEESFGEWLQGIDQAHSILLCGMRKKVVAASINAGIRVLILTGGSDLEPGLLAKARQKGVSVLTTSLDTANSCWLTRLASPVAALVSPDFLQVGRRELLSDLRLKMINQNAVGALVVNEAGQLEGIATKSHLLKSSPVQLVLVDHNELSQAVPGADKVEIIEVVDHHRLGNFHTDRPIRFCNQPLGSTCTLVANLYRQAGLTPTRKISGLMLAGLLSDTIILKSPTTTNIDRQICVWLAELAGRNPETFAGQMFAAGSPMTSVKDARKLITTDFKEYEVDGRTLGLGQVEVVNFHFFYERQQEIEAELKKLRQEKGYALAALLVTDIVEGTSLLLALGPQELPLIIGYPQQEENLYQARGVLSRKKQLVPHLLKIFKN